jgi:hypothetical protein
LVRSAEQILARETEEERERERERAAVRIGGWRM